MSLRIRDFARRAGGRCVSTREAGYFRRLSSKRRYLAILEAFDSRMSAPSMNSASVDCGTPAALAIAFNGSPLRFIAVRSVSAKSFRMVL